MKKITVMLQEGVSYYNERTQRFSEFRDAEEKFLSGNMWVDSEEFKKATELSMRGLRRAVAIHDTTRDDEIMFFIFPQNLMIQNEVDKIVLNIKTPDDLFEI